MMKEEYYAALSHRLTCNKNKSLKCMRLLNERERERERERASNSNHQSSTPTEHLRNA
jgi:hypothetical protein